MSTKPGEVQSDLPELLKLWKQRDLPCYKPMETKHRFVSINEIRRADYDLCHRVYLSGYHYPEGVRLENLGNLFDIVRGKAAAASASENGKFLFATTSAELKRSDTWQIDGESIIIPTVSSTGHGHASIKTIHYIEGKAAFASICVALIPKSREVSAKFVYHYLLRFKDQLLVPLMRGAANVSLNPERLAGLKIPVPSLSEQKQFLGRLNDLDLEVSALHASLKAKLDERNSAQAAFGGEHLGLVAHSQRGVRTVQHKEGDLR